MQFRNGKFRNGICLWSQGIPPVKKEGEKKEDSSNNMEGKGIASRIVGPFKPVSAKMGIIDWENQCQDAPREDLWLRDNSINYITYSD